jgi:hypothetical protein
MTSQQHPPYGESLRDKYVPQQKVRNDSVGAVFRALDKANGDVVAWLELYRQFSYVEPKTLKRLSEVADQAKKIQHPSVVNVIDFQLDQKNALVIVMRFAAGDTLRTWLANQAAGVDVRTAARIVADLAAALQYILDNGLTDVHPGVNPDTIIITQDEPGKTDHPVMVDLGFLYALGDWGAAANTRDVRAREDVHALGQLFFDLLSGFFPSENGATHFRFAEQSQVEDAIKKLVNPAPDASPGALQTILQRALAVDPAQRFADPGEFRRELLELVRTALTADALLTIAPTVAPQLAAPTAAPQTVAPQRTAPQTGDLLVLRQWGGQGEGGVAEKPLRKVTTTIGAINSDITLEEIGSQRLILLRHGLAYGHYYTITDAANGDGAGKRQPIYLDDIPLAPDYAAILTEGAVVRIAHHRLSLRLDPALQAAQLPGAAARGEGMGLASTEFAAAPNELLAIPITLRNTTNEVGRFGIVLHGAPDAWVVNRVESRRLNADETEQLTVHIKLRAVAVATARAYPLIVRAISRVLDAQVAAVAITVVVRPVDDVAATLEPESLRAGHQGSVHILNRGNSPRVVQVQWQERADALVFEPAEAVLSAPPGEAVQVGFRAYVREPRWFGLEKRHAITVLVAPQDGGLARTLAGEVVSRALIPGWLLPLAALAVLLALLISTFLLQPEFAAHAVEIAGTPVSGPPVAAKDMKLTWTPINSCFYSIYKDGVAFKWLIWHWNDEQVGVEILDEAPGIYEVRLRGCLLLGEKSWQVAIASPPPATPAPTPLPAITQFSVTPKDLLLGEQSDLCFSWQVNGRAPDLRIVPNIGAVSPESGEKCLPIADVARSEGAVLYKLVATFGEQQVVSPEVKVTARRAVCTQNTSIPLFIREGPGTNYPERGQLGPGAEVYPIARPFTPQEQTVPERWLQVLVSLDDPRPAWVALNYLRCPDLTTLPVPNLIPPTPTPAPTVTPLPTPTATPVLTPMASVSPEIIREGDCTMLRWDIQGVDKVFMNGVGIVGVGEQEICDPPRGTHIFIWKIIQRDGNIVELTRRLLVNAAQP